MARDTEGAITANKNYGREGLGGREGRLPYKRPFVRGETAWCLFIFILFSFDEFVISFLPPERERERDTAR